MTRVTSRKVFIRMLLRDFWTIFGFMAHPLAQICACMCAYVRDSMKAWQRVHACERVHVRACAWHCVRACVHVRMCAHVCACVRMCAWGLLISVPRALKNHEMKKKWQHEEQEEDDEEEIINQNCLQWGRSNLVDPAGAPKIRLLNRDFGNTLSIFARKNSKTQSSLNFL